MDRGQTDVARAFVPTLVGRQESLARLAESLRPPYEAPLVVLIEGPAGIGKTSLLWAALAQAEDLGVTTLRASPLETEVSFAYATLRDLLDAALPGLAKYVPRAQLVTLLRAFGQEKDEDATPAGLTATSVDQSATAQQVAIAVLASLRGLISRGPTVVAIDDANWVDQASREALTFALRRLAALPIRIVLTQRSEAPGIPPPLGLADPAWPVAIDRVWLEPLSMGALQSVLVNATGATFSRSTLLRIHEISAGNPFFAIELARAVAARGAVLRPGEDLPVPSSLRDLVADRLNAQPVAARRLLLTAAMSSRPSIELLQERAGRDPLPVLKPAIDARLVRVDGSLVSFAHPLFASTLIADAGDNERRQTHAWLGDAEGEDIEARARHMALARPGISAPVAEQLARAAARASERGALTVAGELADLSVERTPPQDSQRIERALLAADAWYRVGDFSAVRERVAKLLPVLEGVHRARALLLDGLATWYLGTAHEAQAHLLQALSDAGADPALAGLINFYLSVFRDDISECRRHAFAAAELLKKTKDRGHEAAALLQAFQLSVALGRRPPLGLLEEGLEAEKEGPLIDRLTSPGIWWAGIGRLDMARDRFRQLLEFDRAYGVHHNVSNLLTRLSEVELWADNWPAARALAVSAMEADLETGTPPGEMARRAMALVDAHEGRLDAAQAAATAGVERSENASELQLAAAWLQVAALVGASRDDPGAVQSATEQAARHLRQYGFREPLRLDPAPEQIEALAALGRLAEAEAAFKALAGRHRRVPKSWAPAAIARGAARIALARDDTAGALVATDAVAQRDPAGWSRFDTARVLLVRGEALRRARSRRAAADVLNRARAIFADLGATVWRQRADEELARLGLTRASSLALTPTETRVAHLAGEGLSTKAVAAELGISPRTVETHLAAVYGKLGVSSRAELGRYMARLGEDSAPDAAP
jgi:DNA-binding CsgD family transcriptional regulator